MDRDKDEIVQELKIDKLGFLRLETFYFHNKIAKLETTVLLASLLIF